ncbi:MAG: hypothetical protein HY815_07785 [Candidatus Riflebacteria bacterium]|nr:hypothetical protein [Candidatus Riflebacteria bacterium]
MRSAIVAFLSITLLSLSTGPTRVAARDEQPFAAIYTAMMADGLEGIFTNPRLLRTGQEFAGVAWEERHGPWSQVGVSVYRPGSFDVFTMPRVPEVRGLGGAMTARGCPMVAYGTPDRVVLGTLAHGVFESAVVSPRGGTVFDLATAGADRSWVLFAQEGDDGGTLCVAAGRRSRWDPVTIDLPAGLPQGVRRFGPARLAMAPDGRPAAVFLVTAGGRSILCRARPGAGGWVTDSLAPVLGGCAPEGRLGLAFDGAGHLQVALSTLPDMRLLYASVDDPSSQPVEPDPGCALRVPQVDLAFDNDGTAHCIYFARTPDGGMQVRLARRVNGRWTTRMVDRTMNKLPTASLTLALQRGMSPYLSYTIGPSRRVIMAYPKGEGPPGLEAGGTLLPR